MASTKLALLLYTLICLPDSLYMRIMYVQHNIQFRELNDYDARNCLCNVGTVRHKKLRSNEGETTNVVFSCSRGLSFIKYLLLPLFVIIRIEELFLRLGFVFSRYINLFLQIKVMQWLYCANQSTLKEASGPNQSRWLNLPM